MDAKMLKDIEDLARISPPLDTHEEYGLRVLKWAGEVAMRCRDSDTSLEDKLFSVKRTISYLLMWGRKIKEDSMVWSSRSIQELATLYEDRQFPEGTVRFGEAYITNITHLKGNWYELTDPFSHSFVRRGTELISVLEEPDD